MRIRTELRGGRTVAPALAGGALRPRVLAARDGPLRVALVQTTACLLSGDCLTLDIRVGAGSALELVEPAATVAHDARGGPLARWAADVTVEEGGRLTWLGAPFVVAEGARVRRSLRLELAAGAAALVRDTLVLGRAGEAPGRAVCDLSATCDGRPLLEETFDTRLAASPVVAGGAKVVDTIALLGVRVESPWALHGPGALRSLPAPSYAAAEAAARPLLAEWRLTPSTPGRGSPRPSRSLLASRPGG